MSGCVSGRGVKNAETAITRNPMVMPLTIPPATYPAIMIHGGVGETSISSMLRAKNFAWKKVVATLENALVTTASITRPGTTKVIYGCPPISPILSPKTFPNTRKYKTDVMIDGKNVCGQMRKMRTTSLRTMV